MFKLIFKKKEVKLEEPTTTFSVDLKPKIPNLPDIKLIGDKTHLNIRYPLIAPYSYAHIFWSEKNKELVYTIEEPRLTKHEKDTLGFLEEGIKELINISFIGVKKGETIIKYLEKNINVLLSELGIKVPKDSYLKLMYYIYRDFVGLNKIESFLCDYFIEDIECNGVDSPVYIVHRKYSNLRTNLTFRSMKELGNLVEKLAQKCGKYISYASPLLDGSLPDGSRVNATYSTDVSSKGPTFTIRKFTKEPWTPVQLMEMNTASPELLAFLWILVEYEFNIMVIGGTGSGKTTFLNAIAFFIPPQARVVSIEDTRELALQHKNWLPSVARPGVGLTNLSGEKYGEITLFDLLKESYRQRPDYVIVGEVRGKEAFVLFQGAASGHPSFSTMHANGVDTMIRRLETPPINLSASLVNSLDAVCVMTQKKVKGKEVRKIKEVTEIINVKEGIGNFTVNTPFMWDPRTDKFLFKTDSYIFNKICERFGVTREKLNREFVLRTRILLELFRRRVFGFKEVHEVISGYYKTPAAVLRKLGIIR
ncbi:secretion system protein E [archaeon]|nr:secretion system protein E [archaeon]